MNAGPRAPAPPRGAGAAPGLRMLGAQIRSELRMSLRQGEQLLVSLGIPLGLLLFFSTVDVLPLPAGIDRPVDFLAPGILALAILSSAMVSLGISTGFDRQYRVLKRVGVTPLGRPRFVAAKIVAVLAVEAIQVALIVPTAMALGWRPAASAAVALMALVLGTSAFAGIGLLLAGTLPGLVTLAVANGLYLMLLLLGGMVIPLSSLPEPLETIAWMLPSAALAEILYTTLSTGGAGSASSWVVLSVWAVGAPAAATALFRWE